MTNLGFAWNGAVVNTTIDHKSAADSAAERHVKDGILPLPCPAQGFAQAGRVRVVIDARGSAGNFAKPFAKLKLGPAFDLVRAANLARPAIDGTTETDTNGLDPVGSGQFRNRFA